MASLKTLGIAIGAGLASALLFAASAKGGALALVIACVTPLPIMIAALGFAQATGLMAAAVSSLVVGALLGLLPGVFFGVLIGFPAWWLAYLSLLARPVVRTAPGGSGLAWYPVGGVVAWAALLAAAIVLAFGAATVWHYGGYQQTITSLSADIRAALAAAEAERSIADPAGIVVRLMPPLLAGFTFLALSVNLWLAARVVQGSGLLSRPWPSLPENLRLQRVAAFVLVGAGLVAFFGGIVGVASGVIVVPLSLAFVLQGLGAAHALTRGLAARRLILTVIYFVTLSLTPSLLALVVLGVVDCLTPLRRQQALPPSPSN